MGRAYESIKKKLTRAFIKSSTEESCRGSPPRRVPTAVEPRIQRPPIANRQKSPLLSAKGAACQFAGWQITAADSSKDRK